VTAGGPALPGDGVLAGDRALAGDRVLPGDPLLAGDPVLAGDPEPGLLLAVDFDGTVCRADAPVRLYAGLIAQAMPPAEGARLLAAVDRYLAEGIAAADTASDLVEAAVLREAGDAWGVVQQLAGRCYRVPQELAALAFTRSRQWMIDPASEVGLVEPVLATLAALRPVARITLVTNSPADNMLPLLRRLGILDSFDNIVAGARKPDGMRRFLQGSLGADLRDRPWRLFSLGDHYRNDIAPAVEVGAAAAYIDRFGRGDGPATARAARVEDLLPVLRAWADDPRAATRYTALAGSGGQG
jgi:FMN phosphatase YigB (HAD superfamily)